MGATRARRRRVAVVSALAVSVAAGSCGGGGAEQIESVAADGTATTATMAAAVDEAVTPDGSADTTTDDRAGDTDQGASTDETGSPSTDGDTIPAEQWRREMDAVCRVADDELAALFLSGEFSEAALVEAWRKNGEAVRSLPRPQGQEQTVEELLALFDEVGEQLEREVEAGVALSELSVPAPDTELGSRLDALTDELGITECGRNAAAEADR